VQVLGTFDIANRPGDAEMKRRDGVLPVEGAVYRIALKLGERVRQQQVGLERARAEAPPRAQDSKLHQIPLLGPADEGHGLEAPSGCSCSTRSRPIHTIRSPHMIASTG